MMRKGGRLRALAPAVMLLALGGCVNLGGGKAPPTLISLSATATAPTGATASGKLDQALLVMEPETDRRLAVQRIVVQVDPANVAYLKDAMWVERPSRMFRALLAETIRAKGGRLVFEDTQPFASVGVRLSGALREMGYDAQDQSVIVRYDAVKEEAGGKLTTRRFESVVPGVSAKPAMVATALNKAANDVASQVADWVG